MNLHALVKMLAVTCIILFALPLQLIPAEFQYTAEFSRADFVFDRVMNYDIVRLKDGDWINNIGKPMLPAKEIKIALPAGMAATGVRIVDTQSMLIVGEYTIFTAQPPRRTSIEDD